MNILLNEYMYQQKKNFKNFSFKQQNTNKNIVLEPKNKTFITSYLKPKIKLL